MRCWVKNEDAPYRHLKKENGTKETSLGSDFKGEVLQILDDVLIN